MSYFDTTRLDPERAELLCIEADSRPDRIESGYPSLDAALGKGLRRGDVMVIGARPGMGLTPLCLNLAARLGAACSRKVAIISGDYPCPPGVDGEQHRLAERMIGIAAGVSEEMLRRHELRPYEKEWFDDAAAKICNGNISIVNGYNFNPGALPKKLSTDSELRGTEVIIIDSMRGLDLSSYGNMPLSPARHVCCVLKHIAIEYHTAIIMTYKIGRQVEIKRADHRPSLGMGDMNIAKDPSVDIAAFLYRDDYYDSCSKDRGLAELIIEKGGVLPMRNTVIFRVDPETHRFYDNGSKEQNSDPFRCDE